MFWIVAAVVVVVLFGASWWQSGRARGKAVERHTGSTHELNQVMRDQGSSGNYGSFG